MINLKFLKPKLLNTLLTIVILSLPLLKERVPFPEGGFVVERYAPIVLIGSYLWLRDFFPFIQMIGFSLLIYFTTSAVLAILLSIFHHKRKAKIK